MIPTAIQHCAEALTRHPEADRIQKLLYWVYKGKWEGIAANLQGFPTTLLLQELVTHTPSFEVLERRLHKAASVLTKPEKYKQIANLILKNCAVLYQPEISNDTPECNPKELITTLWEPEEPIEEIAEDLLPATVVAKPDRFELRRLVIQQVPPLKTKILLFSVLRHPFSFTQEDWQELKNRTLDFWLSELLQKFVSIDVLEARLFAQAAELTTLDQGAQIADAVVQAVRLQAL